MNFLRFCDQRNPGLKREKATVKTTVLTTLILPGRTVGGQLSAGLDLSTAAFRRFEVVNGVNYGKTADYLLEEHYRLEFQWNQNEADVCPQPSAGFCEPEALHDGGVPVPS